MQIDGQTATAGASGDALTPAEMAYLNSGGNDAAALEAEWAGKGDGASQTGDHGQDASTQGQDKAAAGEPPAGQDDDGDDGEEVIVMGKDGKPRAQNGRFVPHQALHKERERHKATKAELDSAREMATRANERIAVFTDLIQKSMTPAEQQQAQTQQQQDDPRPDPEKDIFAFVNWQARQMERMEKMLQEKSENFDKHTAEQRVRDAVVQDARTFNERTPDFRDAYTFLVASVDRELQAVGVADPHERARRIAREERTLVENALQQKVSPSQVIYNLSKARGYTPQQQTQKPDTTSNAKKIEQIAQGQKVAGNPLSNAGGSSGEGLTVEAFVNMSEAEYNAAIAKLSPTQRKALLGG